MFLFDIMKSGWEDAALESGNSEINFDIGKPFCRIAAQRALRCDDLALFSYEPRAAYANLHHLVQLRRAAAKVLGIQRISRDDKCNYAFCSSIFMGFSQL